MAQAQTLLEQVYPILSEINVIYYGAGGMNGNVQQADLNAVTSYSGITVQQLNDGMYALCNGILTQISSGQAQLTQLSMRQ